MPHFAIAGLQLELQNQNNLDVIEEEIRSVVARFPWVQMVVLAELSAFGTSPARAEPMPGATEKRFCAIARDCDIWLIPGSLFEKNGGKIYNTSPVINPAGEVVARYRKMFPFLPYEQGIASGDQFVVFDVPDVGRFGLSICYDMWFPETTRTLACMGAEIIIHPSLTNTIDRDTEVAIARASAASNQCYFIDINVAGRLGMGRSCAFGPGGEVLHQAGTGHEVITLDLDLDHVRRVRSRGWNGLCQVLKSFRDSAISFPSCEAKKSTFPALDALGPLTLPKKL